MGLPRLVDQIKIKEWTPKRVKHLCYLYDFGLMGITVQQFSEILVGHEAMLFEKPIVENMRSVKCPWCEFNSRNVAKAKLKKGYYVKGLRLADHVYTHNKNPVDFQVMKFQQELYTIRLQLVRQGYHGALAFMVEHQCQICLNPQVEGRSNMCSIPESPRNRMRSLKLLGYPIKHLTDKAQYDWSILGLIILLKN